jgi:hypothetical protein
MTKRYHGNPAAEGAAAAKRDDLTAQEREHLRRPIDLDPAAEGAAAAKLDDAILRVRAQLNVLDARSDSLREQAEEFERRARKNDDAYVELLESARKELGLRCDCRLIGIPCPHEEG